MPRGFELRGSMVRDAMLRIAPHHEAETRGAATSPDLILRRPRSGRLEGWAPNRSPCFETRSFGSLLSMRPTQNRCVSKDGAMYRPRHAHSPCPDLTWRTSIAVSFVRAT